jgi:hypothetical protein
MKTSFSLIATAVSSFTARNGRRLIRTALVLGGILAFGMTQQGLATGTIRGTVFDKNSKDKLPGANVVVKGTSTGGATNLDGYFIIKNAPTGVQTVTVAYIGYSSVNFTVMVPEGGTIDHDVYLAPTTIEGAEVLVTAQSQGQLQAINQQLSSDKIVSVVSESKIQELPDFNAAAAISRLPGVSTLQSSG